MHRHRHRHRHTHTEIHRPTHAHIHTCAYISHRPTYTQAHRETSFMKKGLYMARKLHTYEDPDRFVEVKQVFSLVGSN